MRVAVITPSYQTPRAWLDQCVRSVAEQSYRCTHFLVSDGDEALVPPSSAEVRFLRLPGPHGDSGNAARAAGSVVAICEGFDALAYLDADNWYASDHIQRLVELQGRTGAAVCSAARRLVDLDSCEMGPCPEVDGARFVDTSCLFLTRAAFAVVAHWYLVPTAVASVCDRIVWAEILKAGLKRAHEPAATVFYRTRYAAHYEHFGRKPPPGALRIVVHAGRPAPLVGPLSAPTDRPMARPRVSLCMIVRDEEPNLPACLDSVLDLVDEAIVVDTGSTDRTKEFARKRGAGVFDFRWVDDFGAARNESLRHATGDWIFWFDADDRLNELNRDRLRTLFRGLNAEIAGFVMKYSCLTNVTTGAHTLVDQVRLFPNHPRIRWEHRVHEQILPAVQRLGGPIRWTDVVIDHLGYQDPAVCARKHQRNLRLLELEIQEMPDRPFTLFNMGWTLLETGRTAEAIPYLERSLSRCDPRDSIARKLHVLLAKAHAVAGDKRQALECCRRGRETYPDDPELCYHAGLLYFGTGDYRNAAHCLETLLASRPAPYFAIGVEGGVLGYLARHNLAVVYRDQGRVAEAEAQWRLVVAERPQFQLALVALGELHVVQARWADLEGICRLLDKAPSGAADATLLRARGHLGRKEFAQAQVLIGGLLAQTPTAIWPRLLLSRALCEDGTDPEAAKAVLREILALDASHAEARQRLRILQRPAGDVV